MLCVSKLLGAVTVQRDTSKPSKVRPTVAVHHVTRPDLNFFASISTTATCKLRALSRQQDNTRSLPPPLTAFCPVGGVLPRRVFTNQPYTHTSLHHNAESSCRWSVLHWKCHPRHAFCRSAAWLCNARPSGEQLHATSCEAHCHGCTKRSQQHRCCTLNIPATNHQADELRLRTNNQGEAIRLPQA